MELSQVKTSVPLVVIGGSAGSLKPLLEVFSSIPAQSGSAFLVIQHMSPEHESHLDQLIAKRTSMPVAKLKEGMEPLANQVLISQPGQFPALQDTYSYIATENTHRPIDMFCESLSAERAASTVLILLSGTGRDGHDGAIRLKKLNGKIIIQDPETAAFPSMPESVLEEGIADLVLSPAKIGEVINILNDTDKLASYLKDSDLQKADLLAFENILLLVKEHAKQDMGAYKPSTLRRRIHRRMGIRHFDELSQYHNYLLQDAGELEQLSKDLLIGVTAFFRDPEAFKILEESVIPSLCRERKKNLPVRVWVAGCSTGEEAYSIAILLMQCFASLGEIGHLQIFATDIDDAALEVARNGVYSKETLAYMDEDLIKSYFVEDKGGYKINKSVRESIVFASHNLITDPPFSKLDMVVCRNLLIYLNPINQKKLLGLFHFVLNPGGYLFLGSSENIGNIGRHFEAISKQWRIYHQTDAAPRRPPVLPINVGFSGSRDSQASLPGGASMMSQERYYRQLIESYGVVQILINRQHHLLYVSGPSDPYLSIPTGQASYDLLKITRPNLSVSLRSAISQAEAENRRISVHVNVENESGKTENLPIRIEVFPLGQDDYQEMFMVTFSPSPVVKAAESIKLTGGDDWVLKQLVQEINATREDLQRTIDLSRISQEEMRASNEEVMAMNEELQSANEELESSKEELQSLNEELANSNSSLDTKITEVESLNTDLMNLMLSTDTAILMVDEDLNIRHFTPACVGIMRIISSDIGRNIDDVVRLVPDPELSKDCQECLKGIHTKDKELCNDEDNWYLRRLKPYKTSEGKIIGVVISFIDVTDIKQADKLLNDKAAQLEWQSSLLSKSAPIVARDFNDNIIFWNNGARNLYGWQSHEAVGRQIQVLLNTKFSMPFEKIRAQLFDKGFWKGELQHTTRDGRVVIVDSQWTLYRDDTGEAKAIVEVNNDITERKSFQTELDKNEAMFHTMVDWTYNWEYWLSPDNKIIYMTPSVKRVTGYSVEEFIQSPQLLSLIVSEHDLALWEHLIDWDLSSDQSTIKDVKFRITRKNGELCWINATCRMVTDDHGKFLGLRISARDITGQVEAEDQIRTLAYYDPLTRLPNRRLLIDRLSQSIISSARSGLYSALMFIDLDYFKDINDTQGHDIGDKLLVDAAGRISSHLRRVDTVSRQGGDEFVVLLEQLSVEEERAAARAKEIAEHIRKELHFTFTAKSGGSKHHNTCSIGITLFKDSMENVELLMKQADLAMYQAKSAGRNTIRFFNPQMQDAIDARSDLLSKIHYGLENGEFKLFYQPQFDREGHMVAVEGLVRWIRADAGIVPPIEFIPLCEQSNLIVQLGDLVMEQGMLQLKSWENQDKFKNLQVAINVSPRQFLQPNFVETVKSKLEIIGCNPNLLTLEVTENLVLKSVTEVAEQMGYLKELGIRFSLDDFGTGYSSLDKLKNLPFSQLKIDKSFVRDIVSDSNDAAIVKAILAMGKSFELEIVAEGVEDSDQADFLIENECQILQGYLFAKPLSIEEFNSLYC